MSEREKLKIDRREFGLLAAGAGAMTAFSGHPLLGEALEGLVLRTKHAALRMDARGQLTEVNYNGRNYMLAPAALMSLRLSGTFHAPSSAVWSDGNKRLTLHYEDIAGVAELDVREKPTHVSFELVRLKIAQPVELVLWGPYPTSIGEIVGEMVGVVRDSGCAIGIQALNVKTEGGYPREESDIESDELVADDPGIYPGLPAELTKQQRWRGDTAQHIAGGSQLQAYCRNRDHLRVISNWGWEKFDAPPYNDGGVIGSKIALFAAPAAEALATIGEIEVAENLPHPVLNGRWAKQSIHATDSYLIVDFGEASIDRAIELTQRAGLKYLYHSSPFETWGHFRLKPDLFPNGWDGFKECVERGRSAGIKVGYHSLSNFITTNDAYVTPKPDPRLARIGTDHLTAAIGSGETEIAIATPDLFRKESTLNTVVIGEELIQYTHVTESAPWRLVGCKRGAFGTAAAAHSEGAAVGRLLDHPYKVFLTDTDLSKEVARQLAAFCNHTGAQQTSLDGLEGNWSTGMGQYGCSLFTETWWDGLDPSLRGSFINDASMPHHFTWHIATRYNWGEPWYAGFRQSQTMMRLKYQIFYTRNLIPRMLGWFTLRKETTVEDAEWLGARSAGFDAGFALAIRFESKATQSGSKVVDIAPEHLPILDAICRWETARQSRAFPASMKAMLQDVTREFHLADAGAGEWELRPTEPPGAAMRVKSSSRDS